MLDHLNSETALRIRIEVLEEENRQLRTEIGATTTVEFIQRCKRMLGLDPAKSRILAILIAGRVKSRDGILLGYRDATAEPASSNVLANHISGLRRSLLAHDVQIQTIRGEGYELDKDACARVKAMLGLGAPMGAPV